jgi:peptidoglycan/LPS O-acetylase OafA/YrhL
MKNVVTSVAVLDKEAGTLLKGLAIIAVVVLHILSSLPGRIFTTSELNWFFISLDQLGRYSVPLFVALSGYGLVFSYRHQAEKQPVSLRTFYWRRASKLLPQYLWWSLVLFGVISLVPQWEPFTIVAGITGFWSYVLPFIVGGADYHLYFVPMIFQLYLLFPVLWWLFNTFSTTRVMLGLGLVQVLTLGIFHLMTSGVVIDTVMVTDQMRYICAFSWIFYFGLGIALAQTGWWQQVHRFSWWLWASITGAGAGWGWASYQAFMAVENGTDPSKVLHFSKFSIFVFASLAIVVLFKWGQRMIEWQGVAIPMKRGLAFVGRHSYLVYLAHTLFLRIIFGYQQSLVSWEVLAMVTLVWLGAVGISLTLLKSEG